MSNPKRLPLAHTPTPIVPLTRLASKFGELFAGADIWVKRDDMTGGPEAGNKIRKLEYLFAEALARGSDTVVTCGGIQSNHARATAVVGAQLGLRAVLLLRTTSTDLDTKSAPLTGNVLCDRMVDADIQLITPAQYRERSALMSDVAARLAREGRAPYVIPEGGSNGLGAFGYVRAMEEVRKQIDLGLAGGKPFDILVHACGSGGTAAGVALGAARFDIASEVWPIAVSDDRAYFETVVERIVGEARAIDPTLPLPAPMQIVDACKGPAYGVANDEQKRVLVDAARATGLLFDPVYTGKAFYGLTEAAKRGELRGKRVLFLHTGGLPGLIAQGEELREALG
ncbi:MAG: D-cysteine desulfhydrase family protein [Polyangiaceae bacterium]|nr:D-cysteine desulfhydrase family protein [Polyangiaceae bacterium]